MRRKAGIIVIATTCIILTIVLCAHSEEHSPVSKSAKNIVIEIDYGGNRPSRTANVSSMGGKTVLEALQTVARVETSPVDQYVFVTAIDGVVGKRGENAWYYTVDSNLPRELAFTKILEGNERVKWIYKKDVCSFKVDGNSYSPNKGGGENKY